MGKTESGTIWLDAAMTPPYDFYQYWINVHDSDVERFLAFFTFLPLSEIRELTKAGGAQLCPAKQALAFEVTKLAHGEEEAIKARDAAHAAFTQSGGDLSQLPTIPMASDRLQNGITLVDLLIEGKIALSKTEARRLIEQGGIYLNGQRIDSAETIVNNDTLREGAIILRKGKKTYYRIVPS